MTNGRSASGLRVIADSFVVAPPTGFTTRTRLHPTVAEDAALRAIGDHLGSLYRKDLAARIRIGRVRADENQRAERKQQLTAASSSRWAGAITRASEDQYQLGLRALVAEIQTLRAAIAAITARAAVTPGTRQSGVKGYRNRTERANKLIRRTHLQHRLVRAQAAFAAGHPSIRVGGRKLWSARQNLEAAGLTRVQWEGRWRAARMFLTADGESGAKYGNLTIRVSPDGTVTVKVPGALVAEYGSHLTLIVPVGFAHRGEDWADRVEHNRAVRYDITYDVDNGRWYIDASWGIGAVPTPPLTALLTGRVLGVDLNSVERNAAHLTAVVIDPSGNPVGTPHTIPLDLAGLPASTRDGRLRAALTALLDLATQHGAAAVAIENLDFADARNTGRETMGRGRRGKRFRRTVAGIPTRKFRDRITAMATNRGLHIIAVDPAYTSLWGKQHWLKPLQSQTPDSTVTGHHAAAAAIGRRAHGHHLRRRKDGKRRPQRTPAPTHLPKTKAPRHRATTATGTGRPRRQHTMLPGPADTISSTHHSPRPFGAHLLNQVTKERFQANRPVKMRAAGVNLGEEPEASDDADATDKPLAGMKVVISGALTGALAGTSRNEANELVERLGDTSSGSVSKTTDLLVTSEPGSSKSVKAAELGVKTVTPEEFAVMIGRA